MSSTIREPLPTETEGRIEQTHSKRSIRDRLSSAVDHVSTGRFLALPLSDWVCSGFLGVVASAWLFRATYEFPPLVFLVLSAFFIVLAAAGRLILLALQMPTWIDRSFPTALIFGFLPVGFVFAILRVVAGVPFSILCLILIALVAGGLWQFRRSLESTFPRSDSNTIGMIATVLAAFAVTFRVTFFCFPAFLEDGPDLVVKMGDNEFYHASFVTFLDAPGPSWKLGSQNLAGRLSYFYHFVSYVEAAWLRSVTGVTSLTALFGFMTPLGVLFAALASYAFTRVKDSGSSRFSLGCLIQHF